MRIPENIIANADDLGYSPAVNKGILHCFEQGYINSASLMTNTPAFDEAIEIIRAGSPVTNIGVHVDLAEGRPLTDFDKNYLTSEGNWDIQKTGKLINPLSGAAKMAFAKEINAQIEKALEKNISIVHLDSHLHLHTLPAFYKLFVAAAKQHKLKLRLAQTYNEGSYLKYYYRKYINNLFRKNNGNYTDRFETVDKFLEHKDQLATNITVEVMLHPWFDDAGVLTDHYDPDTLTKWINFLQNTNNTKWPLLKQ